MSSELLKQYFALGKFTLAKAKHRFGVLQCRPYNIAVHSFTPANPIGTVILIHGYLDNSATLMPTADTLLQNNYQVILFDLPGHGLSEGYERAGVENFDEYTSALESVLEFTKNNELYGPLSVIGHSTGCTPILSLLARNKDLWDGHTILIAPLVRSTFWVLSKIGYILLSNFLSKAPRVYRKCSDENHFLSELRQDPLRMRDTPKSWIRALYQWEKKFQNLPPFDVSSALIIQGEYDNTVDWRRNSKILTEKAPNFKVVIIKKGRHHLLNESPEKKCLVDSIILNQLEKPLFHS